MENMIIETRASRLWLGEDGILHVINHPRCKYDLQDAKENDEATRKLAKDRKVPIVVDITETQSITQEAREFYSGEEASTCVAAIALIVGSPVSRVIGNFFLGLNKPVIPVRLFSFQADAIPWLKGYIK